LVTGALEGAMVAVGGLHSAWWRGWGRLSVLPFAVVSVISRVAVTAVYTTSFPRRVRGSKAEV
jgi:hypothetical protein